MLLVYSLVALALSSTGRARAPSVALWVELLVRDTKAQVEIVIYKQKKNRGYCLCSFFGRGDKIRTCDFYVPNVALYQAEPHLDTTVLYHEKLLLSSNFGYVFFGTKG